MLFLRSFSFLFHYLIQMVQEVRRANLALVEQVTRNITEQIQLLAVTFCEQTLLPFYLVRFYLNYC